jgi:hypothetical protein
MTPEQKAAYINSQVACALIEMEGMKALNIYRQSRDETIAYDDEAFLDVINRYGIHHNAVVEFFQD